MSRGVDVLAVLDSLIEFLAISEFPSANIEEALVARGEIDSLICSAQRTTEAFSSLGLDKSLINRSKLIRECEESIVVLNAVVDRARGAE